MDTAVPVSPKVKKVLRWTEWLILISCIPLNLLNVDFYDFSFAYWRLFLFIGAASLLIKMPLNQSLLRRQIYVAAGMLLLIISSLLSLENALLLELFIVKACLLLPRWQVIGTTAITILAFLTHDGFRLPGLIAEARAMGVEEIYLNQARIMIAQLISRGTVGVFVVLLGFVFAAEQRGRRKAENLAMEVEALATKLERSRIARDIHDSLGHSLTTLDVQLALAERYNHEGENNKLQQAITTSQQLASQCLAEARQSLRTRHEPSFNLKSSLGTLAEQMRSSFPIQLKVNLPPLPQQLSYQLYLITKEGLANVQKHAQATQATLSLVETRENIVLTLADNGCGFDINNVTAGYGLKGIQERSQLLGGQFNVESQPGQGTQLCLKVPLRC